MLLVAPFLWFVSIGALFVAPLAGFGLYALAWVAGVAGFGLFIYGLVAKSDLERAVLTRQAMAPYQPPPSPVNSQTPQAPQPQGKYCSNCGTLNPLEARFCLSCGNEIPQIGPS
ncbi:MAG: zinc-ribbon domain-containing protein [Thermoplasmata archaeon]